MTTTHLTRREFIKSAGVSLGAAALVSASAGCAGQPTQAAGSPGSPKQAEVETPSFSFGKEASMKPRVLIAYATRTGSTVGVASAIGETLAGRGYAVEVKPFKENPDPSGFQAVILGSAVNGGQWLPEAVEYVREHQQALNQAPVALFCVHIMNLGDDQTSQKNRLAYLNAVRSLLRPVDEAFFAGLGVNPAEQSGIVRWIARTFKIAPEGDCRDWDAIRGWAKTTSLPTP